MQLLNRELTVPLLGAAGALAPGCCASSVRRFFSAAKGGIEGNGKYINTHF